MRHVRSREVEAGAGSSVDLVYGRQQVAKGQGIIEKNDKTLLVSQSSTALEVLLDLVGVLVEVALELLVEDLVAVIDVCDVLVLVISDTGALESFVNAAVFRSQFQRIIILAQELGTDSELIWPTTRSIASSEGL